MRKNRNFIEGTFYHVTSRTNDKIRIFNNKLGRKIMLLVLQMAKDKFRFRLVNFVIMPTHIHLLIEPGEGTNLSMIMQWIKTRSAKWYNRIHGSTDHVWGNRFFARPVKDYHDFYSIMHYIDYNPVKSGLAEIPADWQASGAYYKAHNISGLVDFTQTSRQPYIKLLSPIPHLVEKLLPPAQLSHTIQYLGAYSETIDRLYKIAKNIPKIGDTETEKDPPPYLHYYTGTADYFITEYDGHDTMFGKARFSTYHPASPQYQKFSLTSLKSNQLLQLDFSWKLPDTFNKI